MSSLLQIDGWNHSGKSVLLRLLDGHPEIFATPIHDTFQLYAYNSKELERFLKTLSVTNLRKLLTSNRAGYYALEELSRYSQFKIEIGVQLKAEFVNSIDFYSLDRRLANLALIQDSWKASTITMLMYEALFREMWGDDVSSVKYMAMMSMPKERYLKQFFNTFPNGKIVFIERSIIDIFAVGYLRRTEKKSANIKPHIFNKLLNCSYIYRILSYRSLVYRLRDDFPQSVLIISFYDLINKTQAVIDKLIPFLDITAHDSLTRCTFRGEEVKVGQTTMLGKIIDNAEEILSKEQLLAVKDEIASIEVWERNIRRALFPKLMRFILKVRHAMRRSIYWCLIEIKLLYRKQV
jgi:hypothetical protein